ncbi:hypothetical protein P872_19860 [Rhodonellum psychrophilum GCM71 = DSM 17998]|uniref:Uncharacterized protein n=1 Tax=Rhodonellum psychrophilum GCM71 = DSM 17998 TaxID=1123057 RepID=U5BUQ1_9BACT|nr:hypothetical protein P872_19860 [Rhodonellum psychrophilum GCM71 = DSM 17998]
MLLPICFQKNIFDLIKWIYPKARSFFGVQPEI